MFARSADAGPAGRRCASGGKRGCMEGIHRGPIPGSETNMTAVADAGGAAVCGGFQTKQDIADPEVDEPSGLFVNDPQAQNSHNPAG